jgi:hypothetical protein
MVILTQQMHFPFWEIWARKRTLIDGGFDKRDAFPILADLEEAENSLQKDGPDGTLRWWF